MEVNLRLIACGGRSEGRADRAPGCGEGDRGEGGGVEVEGAGGVEAIVAKAGGYF